MSQKLINKINELKNSNIKSDVDYRLNKFKELNNSEDWFSELCFCILTANSKAATALEIEKELKGKGFHTFSQSEIRECIRKNKHRFHNNKSKFIVEARKHKNIKEIIQEKTTINARTWLVDNIKGIGYKESSHFLRNVGYNNVAILDRHILNLMVEHKLLKEKPKTLNKNNYPEIEKKLGKLASSINMSQAELDLYLWSLKTGKVLK
ncbi:N-glycosylase/DNA lyase [Candidatus Woesearchaeota archaeon]|nr:N-glycosylase/DNA lyase [Candidatus Woesearchaeota archaeon]